MREQQRAKVPRESPAGDKPLAPRSVSSSRGVTQASSLRPCVCFTEGSHKHGRQPCVEGSGSQPGLRRVNKLAEEWRVMRPSALRRPDSCGGFYLLIS